MTISYAIGRNNTEGRAHTMCIEGTQGTQGGTGLGRAVRRSSQSSQLVLPSTGCENPKPSLTELEVLEHGLYAGAPVSKVLLRPLTGVSGRREAGPFEARLLSANDAPPTTCASVSSHRGLRGSGGAGAQ